MLYVIIPSIMLIASLLWLYIKWRRWIGEELCDSFDDCVEEYDGDDVQVVDNERVKSDPVNKPLIPFNPNLDSSPKLARSNKLKQQTKYENSRI